MKITKLYTLTCILFLAFAAQGQNVEEEAYLHINSSNVVSGETILFSAFVNSKSTNRPSPLSKILYVELINEEGKVALQTKVSLENGRGYGDIFVSSMFTTGVYQLLAYTRWMKNFNRYFEVPVTIINPFETVEIAPQVKTDWSMNFFVPCSGILLNQENAIVFQAVAPEGSPLVFKGKVMDSSGTPVLDFSPINHGIGSFIFKPISSDPYQVVIEDQSGGFHFYDLPKISSQGSNILITESQVAYDIKIQSTDDNFEGSLIITDKGQTILNQLVVKGSTHLLPKRTLKPGLYKAILLSKDKVVLESRWFFQHNENKQEAKSLPSEYAKRSPVNVQKNLSPGTYSVSSRRIRTNMYDYRPSAEAYNSIYHALPNYYNLGISHVYESSKDTRLLNIILSTSPANQSMEEKGVEIQYLPDYRGELIQGKVTDEKLNPLTHGAVMYSSLGTNLVSIASSDSLGNFLLNVSPINEDNTSFISLLDTLDYRINIESNYLKQKPPYTAPSFTLDSMMLKDIVQSSIHAQVENAYFDLKKDSTFHAANPMALFSEFEYFYYLDDYNRFPTIRETFIEYMPAVAVRQKNGKPVVHTRSGYYNPSFKEPTLILLDGVPVDVESLYTFSPYKVKSIGVIGNRYYLGPKVFDGVISLHTFDGNLHNFKVNEDILQFTYQGLQPKKVFYQPDYSNELTYNRVPDRREQLLWAPNVTTQTGELDLQFYTSDVSGKYELMIEGFTFDGQPVSIKEVFEVKD